MTELLDVFRAGEGVNRIRDAVQLVFQELIETEATERIAARYDLQRLLFDFPAASCRS